MTAKLIEALEKSEGPSRELDEQIAKVLGLFPSSKDWRLIYKKERIWRRFPYGGDKYTWKEQWEPEHYTASIDAALTLVPEGYAVENMTIWTGENTSVEVLGTHFQDGRYYHHHSDGRYEAKHKCAAIALCIAALRAIGDDDER